MHNDKVESGQIAGAACEVNASACLDKNTLKDVRQAIGDGAQPSAVHDFDRSDPGLVKARDSLRQATAGQYSPAEYDKMTEAIEARAKSVGLSPAQIEKTYEQLARIASAHGDKPMTSENRQVLTKEFMQHLGQSAPPLSGHADTCDWGILTFRMMQKEPDVLAKMVADMATKSGFKLPDGRHIKIDHESLQPDGLTKKGGFANRDYFGQIATVGLNNVKWATESEDPDGNKVKLGSQHFQQLPDTSDLGERVWRVDHGKRVVSGSEEKGSVGGLAYLDDTQKVEALLTGKKHPDYAVYLPDANTKARNEVRSGSELAEMLKVMSVNGDLPAAMQAYANKSPVREIYLQRNPDKKDGPDSMHGLAIIGVRDVGGKTLVTVYNPWGYLSEVPVATLFDALSDPPKPDVPAGKTSDDHH